MVCVAPCRLLQPLDVKAFAQIKAFLRRRFISVTQHGLNDRLILTAIRDVFAAVQKYFVGRSWARALDTLGLNGSMAPSSKHILLECGWNQFPPIFRTCPTSEIICHNTPRGRRLHTVALQRCMPPAEVVASLLSRAVALRIPPSVTGEELTDLEPFVRRRRVLPVTFFGIDHDSDNASE